MNTKTVLDNVGDVFTLPDGAQSAQTTAAFLRAELAKLPRRAQRPAPDLVGQVIAAARDSKSVNVGALIAAADSAEQEA